MPIAAILFAFRSEIGYNQYTTVGQVPDLPIARRRRLASAPSSSLNRFEPAQNRDCPIDRDCLESMSIAFGGNRAQKRIVNRFRLTY